jgi:hypothetical protein
MTSSDFASIEQRVKLWLAQQGCVADAGQGCDRGSSGCRHQPPLMRRALELRKSGAQAALKKIQALLVRYDRDGQGN